MNSHQLSISLVATLNVLAEKCWNERERESSPKPSQPTNQSVSQPANDTKNMSSTPSNLHTDYVSISFGECLCVWVCDIHFRSVGFTNIKMCAHKFSIFSKFIHYKSSRFHVLPNSLLHSHSLPLLLLLQPLYSFDSLLEHIKWDRLRSFVRSLVGWLVGWLNCCVVVKVITIYLYVCWNNAFRVLHIPCNASHIAEMEFCWI